jgi:transposase
LLFPLLPLDPAHWTLQRLTVDETRVTIFVQNQAPSANCPLCREPAQRVHSRYVRHLADLPWQDRPVQLHVEVRRFFCPATTCPRRIFAERLPTLTRPYARTTARLRASHCTIGFALGGEAGARLAARLAMPTSPDTLLRRIRQAPLPERPVPRVLGVDDWAWRKGRRYGTILHDLERKHPVDLLPDREAGTLAAWLKAHPGVEIITRDRAGAYAQGARLGAPDAIQVADRWHLLGNLRAAVERLVDRLRSHLRRAAEVVAGEAASAAVPAPPAVKAVADVKAPGPAPEPTPPLRLRRKELARRARLQRRRERYDQVVALHGQGLAEREIGRQLKISRGTVARWLRAADFPERTAQRRQPRPHPVDAHLEYIRERQREGCRNLKQITRELMAQGHPISYHQVHRRLGGSRRRVLHAARIPVQVPSPRRTSWILLQPLAEVASHDRPFVEALSQSSAEIAAAAGRAQEFVGMVRGREPAALEGWLARTQAENMPAELRGFARALRQDQAAVTAALELPWSNGPVEGSVNRLKMLKRQMFGRAGIDLLRQRFLHAG